MTKHPFTSGIKKYLSAVDQTLDIENLDSTALLVANDIKSLISPDMYTDIVAIIETIPDSETEKWTEVLELLRYAMAPFVLYKHFIWLQLRVSNNAITTYKSQDETTAFKYQTDEGKESLLEFYAANFSELIDYLETNKTVFKKWEASTQRAEIQALLIKTYREFDSFYPTEGGALFFLRSRSIQKEILDDELKQHVGAITAETPEATLKKLKRALVYFTLSRCIVEWDYMYIPAPIKRTINNEHSPKSGKEVEHVKERVSAKFRNMGEEILKRIDLENEAAKQAADIPKHDIEMGTFKNTDEDKHVLMM